MEKQKKRETRQEAEKLFRHEPRSDRKGMTGKVSPEEAARIQGTDLPVGDPGGGTPRVEKARRSDKSSGNQ